MRILSAHVGTRGDTQPHIALGIALARAGHQVRLHIPPDYEMLVPKVANMSVVVQPVWVKDFWDKPGVQKALSTGNTNKMLKLMFEDMANVDGYKLMTDSVMAEVDGWKPDVIMSSGLMVYNTAVVARYHNLPLVVAAVQPTIPTEEFFTFGGSFEIPKCARMWIWRYLFDKIAYPEVLRLAARRYWQERAPDQDPLEYTPWRFLYEFNPPHLFGFSLSTFDPPADWQPFDHKITGSWIMRAEDQASVEPPDPQLVAFLRDSPLPPVYIGWGSMMHISGQHMTELAVRALYHFDRRLILFKGSSNNANFDLGIDKLDRSAADYAAVAAWAESNVFVLDGVSHEWLFPQVACIVHHGGAGTSVAAFRSGTPSFITPFNFDQFEFARVSVNEGVGPDAPQYTKLSPQSLGALIEDAVTDSSYRQAAVQMRRRQLAEDGTAVAVRAFPRMAARNIWEEEKARRARGDKFAIRPPEFFLWWEKRKSELLELPSPTSLDECMLDDHSPGLHSAEEGLTSAEQGAAADGAPLRCDEEGKELRALRRLQPAAGVLDEQQAWTDEWRERFSCWFVGLPLPTQTQLGNCMGALSLTLGSQLDASWRAAQALLGRSAGVPSVPTAEGAAEPGCEWVTRGEQLVLPEMPTSFPADFDFTLPPIPRLLPNWQQLQSLVEHHRPGAIDVSSAARGSLPSELEPLKQAARVQPVAAAAPADWASPAVLGGVAGLGFASAVVLFGALTRQSRRRGDGAHLRWQLRRAKAAQAESVGPCVCANAAVMSA